MPIKTRKKHSQTLAFIKANPDLFSFVKAGDIVEGEIIDIGSRAIIVDLLKYGTGVIYRGELLNARDTVQDLRVGAKIQAKVIEPDNEDGFVELSLREAGKQKSWVEVEELHEKEEIIEAPVVAANKGGLIVEVGGLQGFIPASQLSSDHYPQVEDNDKNKIEEELQKLIGTTLAVKIIDINPRTNKLIVSEKAANEVGAKELAKNYEVGQIIEGMVSGVADFGVFVKFTDNPDVEGLIHVSELAHRVVENPKEVLKVDDVVKAKIVDIKNGKISLSLKALEVDPWEKAGKKFKAGQEVKGTVYSFHPFGATVNLDDGIQGQIHVTEFGGVEEMKKKLTEGQSYTFTIKEVKPEDKRITLSLKK